MPKRRLTTGGIAGVLLALAVAVFPANAAEMPGSDHNHARPDTYFAVPAGNQPPAILHRREPRIVRWTNDVVTSAALRVALAGEPAVLAAVRARTRAVAASERSKTSAGVRQWTERIGGRSPPNLRDPETAATQRT